MTPEPLLATVDNYRGTIYDIDRALLVTPAEFASCWQSLARRLADAGLTPGDRVVVVVGNGPQFIACWAAILAQGGSPLFVHVDTPAAELKRTCARFRARFAISDALSEANLTDVEARAKILSTGADWCQVVWGDFGETMEQGDRPMLRLPGVPLHPTSGTTGEFKVAVRPVECAMAEVNHYVSTIGVSQNDTLLALAPMSHAYAHGWCVVTPMVTGANLVTMRKCTARLVYQACQEHGITILPGVASMLDTFMFGAGQRLYNPQRRVITGGAPLSERTATTFERISGSRVRPLYGATETGGIAVSRGDTLAIGGYVGPPFDGVSVEIRPTTEPNEFAAGIGQVYVRSASVMIGYLSDEVLDTSVLEDGWFNTGDLGRLDPDGALHLSGRRAEVINISGMKVLPREVEEVIAALPGVAEVKVYPGRTRHGSLHVKAAVVAEGDVDAAKIKAHCQQHLIYYKRPARVVMMDALPKSAAGKVLRDQLP